MSDGYRVSSTHPEPIHTGAEFAPGETAVGIDPSDPFDAERIAEGKFVPIKLASKPKASKPARDKADELGVDLAKVDGTGAKGAITVADVEQAHDNQEVSA